MATLMRTYLLRFQKSLILIILFSICLTSCLTTKTTVGRYNETQGVEYKYSKGKQVWFFWGLIPLGRTNVNTPDDGNCKIVTRFTFGDVLISLCTGGFVTTYTIKVIKKRDDSTKNMKHIGTSQFEKEKKVTD